MFFTDTTRGSSVDRAVDCSVYDSDIHRSLVRFRSARCSLFALITHPSYHSIPPPQLSPHIYHSPKNTSYFNQLHVQSYIKCTHTTPHTFYYVFLFDVYMQSYSDFMFNIILNLPMRRPKQSHSEGLSTWRSPYI